MLSPMHTVLSGLAAFTKQVEVTGHNVANVNTEEFKKSNTELVSLVSVESRRLLPVVRTDDSADQCLDTVLAMTK